MLGVPQRGELAHRIEGLPHVRRDILCGRDPSGGDECHGEVRVHRVEFEDIPSEFPDHSPVDRLSEHPAGLFLLPAQPFRGTRIPSGQVGEFDDIRLDLHGLIRQIVGFVVELDRPVADRHVLSVDRGERVDVPVRPDDVRRGTALPVGIGDLEHPLAQIRCRYPSVRVGHGVQVTVQIPHLQEPAVGQQAFRFIRIDHRDGLASRVERCRIHIHVPAQVDQLQRRASLERC